ncbi:P-loop NTPase fold protein [Pseudonocardia saturnea]
MATTTTRQHDDLGQLSTTVAQVLTATPAEVTATEMADDILFRHPEYADRRAYRVSGAKGDRSRDRRTWLTEVRALYDRAAAPLLHGRLVIIGLARLEPGLRATLDRDGFHDQLVREVYPPIETLWARPAPADRPPWARFGPSARAAVERAAERSGGTLHTEQLLLGLYEEPGGPARSFLDQIGTTRAMLEEALTEGAGTHPADTGPRSVLQAFPPMSRHVEEALQHAASLADELGSRTIDSGHLFFGLLSVEDCSVAAALAELGVTAAGFRAWSEQEPAPPLAGGVSADRVDPDEGIPEDEDDLSVSVYAAMLAATIARTTTRLPLSIGLFGEWGSGKSYFMGLLREQVRQRAASGDPAYHAGIVQIGFNAWSYADANLWASLGDEIFRELAEPVADDTEEDRHRRDELRSWMADEQGQVKELQSAKATAAEEVATLRTELGQRRSERRTSAVTLLKATVEAVASDPRQAAELEQAWATLGLRDEAAQARILADTVTGAGDAVTAIGRAADRGNGRYVVAAVSAAGLVMLIVGLASSGVLAQWITGTGIATLLASAAAFAAVTRRITHGVRSIADLANQIRERTETGGDAEVRQALQRVVAAEAREQVIESQLDQAVARVGELGRELLELSPGQHLYAFLADRAASEDYRRQLSLIATIRSDFERLARLQRRWREDQDGGSPRPIDRIVLYIDDLDRCTPQQVVAVLQAVHLLLALDLFVVVVGVDPRWLLHSLRDQYRSTLTDAPSGSGPADADRDDADRLMLSTPHDYLEKIFNVPFVLPGITPGGFGKMIRRLSLPEVDAPAPAEPADGTPRNGHPSPDGPSWIEPPTDPALRVQDGSEIAAGRHGDTVAPTPLTGPELEVLSSLAPLVRSPRETKRLLNLYRMLRSTQDLSDASRFLGRDGAAGEFQAVAVLLGLLTASPHLLGHILFAPPDPGRGLLGGISHRGGAGTWAAFLGGLRPRDVDGNRRNDLCESLSDADVADWLLLVERAGPASALVTLADLTAFGTWAPHVARFSFLLAPVTR